MVPICLDKSPHQINSLWADFSKQMGTICLGQTTRAGSEKYPHFSDKIMLYPLGIDQVYDIGLIQANVILI